MNIFFTYSFRFDHSTFFDGWKDYYSILIMFELVGIVGSTTLLCLFKEIIIRLILILAVIIYNLILFSVYKCIRFCNNKDLRIDFIYSKNFDKIFIGVVKNNEKYRKTLEYEMNNIEKFYIEGSIVDSHVVSHLKVLFKNEKSEYIYSFNFMDKENSEGLIYLLNEKLKLININNNINNINHIDNDITP